MSTIQTSALSLGLVGVGGAGQRLIQATAHGIDSAIRAAVCLPTELHDTTYHTGRTDSYEALLQRDDINAIYLATPVHTHVELALLALRAGKHVLIEKPAGLSLNDLKPILEAADGTRAVGTAFKKRFGEGIDCLQRMGWKPGINTWATYRWHIPAPPESDWRYRPELAGGGVVMDLGSHVIDLFECILGPIARVNARTRSMLGTRRVESIANIALEFLSGARGLIELSWHANSASYEFRIEDKAQIFRQGTLNSQEDAYWQSNAQGTRHFLGRRSAEYMGLLEAFGCAISGQRHRLPSVHDGARNIYVIEAIYLSAVSNQPIELKSRGY